MKERLFPIASITLLLITGCGQKSVDKTLIQTTALTSIPAAQVSDNSMNAEALQGNLKGKVLFEGAAPAPAEISVRGNPECAALHPGGMISSEELIVNNGALQNVFVYVKEGLQQKNYPVPSNPVTIQNKNCMYVPHVTGVQVNQPVILLNGDPTLHNVHSYAKDLKPWNLGLPFQGMKQTKKFEAPEIMVRLKCDVHPWMSGYVGVLPHPYFFVTGADGSFELKNLPPGEYLIEAWHEKLGVQSQKIKIEPQEAKEIEFKFKT